ncbi:concanavalin A-like lectin/glucanase domain-containing protein [Rhexocercosporidium sp. MPI-PUGE-AT-0058]|nr:concanavalin A-like lectin/glucanase domain-containing protein [Rhexocercosporidium sp. MPI-PUGE-AT-0058]
MKSLIPSLMVLGTSWASTIPTRSESLTVSADLTIDINTFSKPGFKQTFLDTFTGIPGTIPSSRNWIFDLGTSYPGGAPRWGNNEFETYTKDPSNIHITPQGTLAIIPQLSKKGEWTSSRIETQRSDFVAAKGGKLYIEAKIKLPNTPKEKQQGIWPAFWALGSEFRGNYTNWPSATEWDFLEVINGVPTVYSTLHCGTAPGGFCNEYNGLGSGGRDFEKGVFHTLGFLVDRSVSSGSSWGLGRRDKAEEDWKSETLTWFLDGKEIFELKGETVGDKATWAKVAHEEHFLLLNVAVGGNWPGAPNNMTVGGVASGMEVGYVGVWNSL